MFKAVPHDQSSLASFLYALGGGSWNQASETY